MKRKTIPKMEVLRRLCRLAAAVRTHHSRAGHSVPADCFCGQSVPVPAALHYFFTATGGGGYRFDPTVLTFMER